MNNTSTEAQGDRSSSGSKTAFLRLAISERDQAEQALRESEARYRAVVENSPDGIAVSVDDQIIYLNPAALKIAGVEDARALRGRDVLEFVHEDFRELAGQRRAAMQQAGIPTGLMEGKLRRPDGLVLDSEWMAVPISYEGRPAVLQCFRDITERKRAEECLHRSELRYRVLFECAQDAIFLLDGEGVADCNPPTLKLFGCRRDQIIGQNPLDFSPPEQPDGQDSAATARQRIDQALAGTAQFFEWRHRRLDGSEFDAEVSLNRLDLGGKLALLAIIRDVSARKAAEAALRRGRDELEERVRERTCELLRANERLQELDRLKSEFLATMSHELRTPLNSIIGFTGCLRQGFAGPINPEQRKQLDLVFGSARHLLSLITDLLDLSRIEAGKIEIDQSPFEFGSVIAEVVEVLAPMARQKDLLLRTRPADPVIPMLGDRKRCFQVLLNLANNAVKFTEAGHITIRTRTARDFLVVTVMDTGIGIRPEQMGKLFEAFRQLDGSARRNYEGTGLGLHLCRRLLTLMGGEINAWSQFGKGSRFTFTLPLRLDALDNLAPCG